MIFETLSDKKAYEDNFDNSQFSTISVILRAPSSECLHEPKPSATIIYASFFSELMPILYAS